MSEIKMNLKLVALILIIAITLNLILFAFGKISQFSFWVTVIVTAVIAYKVLPKLKKKTEKA